MKITFLTVIVFSMVLLLSATVWEGVAEAGSDGDMPGNYNVATNSFPRNTVVDITNLENGKMVRVKVVSGLEQSGLLALLSRTAAESIDLRGNFSARIRMTQPPDDIAFSLFNLGPIASPSSPAAMPRTAEADTPIAMTDDNAGKADVPIAMTDDNAGKADVPIAKTDDNAGKVAQTTDKGNTDVVLEHSDTATEDTPLAAHNSALPYNPAYNSASNLLTPVIAPILETPAEAAGLYGEAGLMYGKLSLIPSEERIPASVGYLIAPEDIIPSIGAAIAAQPEVRYLPPVEAAARSEVEYVPPMAAVPVKPEAEPLVEFSPFQAPLISRLEAHKWYVQVGTYGRAEYVEDEISRIGTDYPLAVQNVGTDTNPVFRVLLGPLNQGESGAMLQRFKSLGYADAFVRHN